MQALVVEDDRRVGRFIAKGLREASYVVELVDNGEAGLRSAIWSSTWRVAVSSGLDGGST